MKVPCYNCKERTETCHAECLKYKEFQQGQEEIYKKRRQEIINNNKERKYIPVKNRPIAKVLRSKHIL